ncbi:hypothetical protein DSCA_59970 [Desulfosarcina alkanivorans]|jgi:polar amino acid transport system substrate-binding protein|uniref:Uncharacterized protein n=1 Tax=Desulfosarcina alkanivorans TaxID=571177 RepID=A0A5K7Z662_9BACT|nr:hypothetical protein DSCA_59970 [Desulfosarcina alkanivorans]
MNPTTVNSNESLFKILGARRVDIIVITRVNGLEVMQQLKIPGIRPLEPPIESYPLYHYRHKKNRHLMPEITAALEEMEKEGLIKKIRARFIAERFGGSE